MGSKFGVSISVALAGARLERNVEMTNRSMKNSAGIATVQNFSMPPCMPPMTMTTFRL